MPDFASIWSATAEPVADDATERDTIAAAKLGDEAATLRLFSAYLPTMKQAVGHFSETLGRDDARQTAVLGLLRAIQAFNAEHHLRLAAVIREYLHLELQEAERDASSGFSVPPRTVRRALGILERAGRDVNEAVRIAPEYQMEPATLLAVLAAISSVTSLDQAIDARGEAALYDAEAVTADRAVSDIDDRQKVRVAMAAVTPLERDVCRMAYGFTDPDPIPDAEIGHRMGMGRVRTLRVRHRALSKMSAALAA